MQPASTSPAGGAGSGEGGWPGPRSGEGGGVEGGNGGADGKQTGESRFAAYSSFPTEQPMKKRANAARLNNLCKRLRMQLEKRRDETEDEHRRKSQRKSPQRPPNDARWSVEDRILVFREVANEFLRGTCVWQLIPESTRVVVLDSDLTVQQLIDALVSEGQQNCAPVWDSKNETFCGIATWKSITSALITSNTNLKRFLETKIGTISLENMIQILPKDPLKEAIQASMTSESRTFCVVGGTWGGLETGDILNVFTRQRILKFLFGQLSAHAAGNAAACSMPTSSGANDSGSQKTEDVKDKASESARSAGGQAMGLVKKNLFDEILMFTVEQLGINNRDGVHTVTQGQACLKDALKELVNQNLGRVVVLDKQRRALEMYSRSDIRILSGDVLSVLDLDVVEAAKKHPRLCTFCSRTDTLQSVMAKMAEGDATAGEVLVCVGPNQEYEGLVSFTSLFRILDQKYAPPSTNASGPNRALFSHAASADSNSVADMDASPARPGGMTSTTPTSQPQPMDSQ